MVSKSKEDSNETRVVGKLLLEIHQKPGSDDWHLELVPISLTENRREFVRLAMLASSIQKYGNDTVNFMNRFIENIENIPESVPARKGKIVPDTEKHQTKPPFETEGTVTGRVTSDKPNSEEVPKDVDTERSS